VRLVWLLVLVLLVWLVMRHLAAERRARELEMARYRAALSIEVKHHRRELSTFEYEQDGARWEFDFESMTVVVSFEPPAPVELDYRTYDLKRGERGAWHYRMPDVVHRQRVAELSDGAADEAHGGRADAQSELESLGERPEWTRVPEALAAKVESRYELFLRHYKR
jgi:hypothetical protein